MSSVSPPPVNEPINPRDKERVNISSTIWQSYFQNLTDILNRLVSGASSGSSSIGSTLITFVKSFNGRTGAVTPQAGDYTFDQIDGALPFDFPPNSQQEIRDIERKVNDLFASISFISNHDQDIRNLSFKVDDALALLTFEVDKSQQIKDLEDKISNIETLSSIETNNDQRINDLAQLIQDTQTLYWMEA